MDCLLLLVALIGHTFLWVALINRLHATGLPHGLSNGATYAGFVLLGLIVLGFGAWFWLDERAILDASEGRRVPWPAMLYLALSWGAAVIAMLGWYRRYVLARPPDVARYHRARVVKPLNRSADHATEEDEEENEDEHHFLLRLPGNETLQLDVAERAIDIRRLPPPLDRLGIMHLSDFHFTGRVKKAYFQEVVRQSNRFEPDLVAVTGDLIDHANYIDWIPDTLGKLTAAHGVYFVLGNHDLRVDARRIRHALTECGLVDLGGRWIEIEVHGQPIVLAGNELPWCSPAADLKDAPNGSDQNRPLRIALSHSPDQLDWARAHDIDLLLAGHTHGGQIRLPWLGPILTPSRSGVKYAWGVYDTPPTVMHVSRGVSGEHPIRLNCPPEITRLVLHAEEEV